MSSTIKENALFQFSCFISSLLCFWQCGYVYSILQYLFFEILQCSCRVRFPNISGHQYKVLVYSSLLSSPGSSSFYLLYNIFKLFIISFGNGMLPFGLVLLFSWLLIFSFGIRFLSYYSWLFLNSFSLLRFTIYLFLWWLDR